MLITVLFAGWTASGEAAPITFTFTGTVTQINTVFGQPRPEGISAGSAIDGHFTFESTASDRITDPRFGLFTSPAGAPYGLSLTIGPHTFSTSGLFDVNVENDADGEDSFGFRGCSDAECGSTVAALIVRDSTGAVFDSDALRLTPPPFSAFDSSVFWIYGPIGPNGNLIEIVGWVNSLACGAGCEPASTPVPEPGTLGLVGLAVSALIGRRARSRRNQA
jgi:hypothetical protein